MERLYSGNKVLMNYDIASKTVEFFIGNKKIVTTKEEALETLTQEFDARDAFLEETFGKDPKTKKLTSLDRTDINEIKVILDSLI